MVALIESTTLPVTALYAGLLSILFAYLALRVGLTRASNGVMHGDGGKQDIVRKARAQGNLAEYLPIFLILLALLELNKGLSSYFLHLLGIVFTVARISHAAQLSFPDSFPKQCREFGFLATASILSILGVLNLISYTTTSKR
ncbi:hypothetical protein WJX77_008741 [Trebouxia sp. C0004]